MGKKKTFFFFEKFWLGGAPPQPARILAGGVSPPQTPPLDGFSRGAAAPRTPRVFFSPLTTRAPPGRPAERPGERPAKRPAETIRKRSETVSKRSEIVPKPSEKVSKPLENKINVPEVLSDT